MVEHRQPYPENKEKLPLTNKKILITGGTTGIGGGIAEMAYRQGATVIASTRSEHNFLKLQKSINDPDSRLHPMYADVTNPVQLNSEMQRLADQGIIPDVTILSHAAGMDNFLTNLYMVVRRFNRKHSLPNLSSKSKAERLTLYQPLKERVGDLAKDGRQLAMNVNFHGSVNVLEAIVQQATKSPRLVIDISSLPSSFYENVDIPSYYEYIAYTKRLFERRLIADKQSLTNNNIYPVIVSGGLVLDTKTGCFLKEMGKFFPSDDLPDMDNPLTIDKFASQVINLLFEDPSKWHALPQTLYVLDSETTTTNQPDIDFVRTKVRSPV